MSPRKAQKHFTAQEKVAIIRRHLVDKIPLSQLCEQHQLAPSVFYRWQQEFFEKGAAALERKNAKPGQARAEQHKIAALEAKLTQKNEVLSELMEEHVKLKKTLGAG
jgi:transposase-like protein